MFDPWSVGASAAVGYLGQQEATKSAREANEQNLRFQQQMYQQQDPFSAGGHRQQYAGQLDALMKGGPASMEQDPMYQWLMSQGQQAVERQYSAAGLGQSGAEKSALMAGQFGTANIYFTQQYNRLSELSGAKSGRTAPMQGTSGSDAYNMSLGNTNAIGGVIRGISGMFGSGSGGSSNGPGSGFTPGMSNPTADSDFYSQYGGGD